MIDKLIIPGIELSITNEREILHMAGPWVGDLSVNRKKIAENCIVDNFVYQESKKLFFFVKFHVLNYNNFFTINFYDIDQNEVFQFDREFEMIYIKEFISENKLEIFYAFHDQLLDRRDIFILDKEEFSCL